MDIIEFDLSNVASFKNLALCLGFFDGIHLGHKTIIKKALSTGKDVAVLSFDLPPMYVIGRKDTARSLTSIDDKANILEEMGVKYLLIMTFNDRIKELHKNEFINLVLKVINPDVICCGEDYTFGKNADGDARYLKNFFDVKIMKLEMINGQKFSSKTIRHLIFDGKVEEANSYLGHFYRVGGFVVEGNHLGRNLGFPTANMELDFPYVIPSNGVYMGYAHIHFQKYKCLISVGTHPTLKELDAPIIEVYVIDFKERIYGDFMYIEFVKRIRDMIKFKEIEELTNQIKKDKELALKELD